MVHGVALHAFRVLCCLLIHAAFQIAFTCAPIASSAFEFLLLPQVVTPCSTPDHEEKHQAASTTPGASSMKIILTGGLQSGA